MTRQLTPQQIFDAINMSRTMRQASQILNIPYRTFIERAKKLGVYKPNQNQSGITNLSNARNKYLIGLRIPLNEILEGKHPTYHARGGLFKKRLYALGIKKEICEECGQLPTWNGKPLTLELEHVDGNHKNHELSNLKILCMHCHSQTRTYRRKKSSIKPL